MGGEEVIGENKVIEMLSRSAFSPSRSDQDWQGSGGWGRESTEGVGES